MDLGIEVDCLLGIKVKRDGSITVQNQDIYKGVSEKKKDQGKQGQLKAQIAEVAEGS